MSMFNIKPGTFEIIETIFNTSSLIRPQVEFGSYDQHHPQLRPYFNQILKLHTGQFKVQRILFEVFAGKFESVHLLEFHEIHDSSLQALLPAKNPRYDKEMDLFFLGALSYENGIKMVKAIHYAGLGCPFAAHGKLFDMICARDKAVLTPEQLQNCCVRFIEFNSELTQLVPKKK